jgi:hypothetical protein
VAHICLRLADVGRCNELSKVLCSQKKPHIRRRMVNGECGPPFVPKKILRVPHLREAKVGNLTFLHSGNRGLLCVGTPTLLLREKGGAPGKGGEFDLHCVGTPTLLLREKGGAPGDGPVRASSRTPGGPHLPAVGRCGAVQRSERSLCWQKKPHIRRRMANGATRWEPDPPPPHQLS